MKGATYVPGVGPIYNCQMAFVGEQPGKQEIFKRKPFVGSSGQELNEDMHAANIIRSYCYLTNVFKDLDNYLSSYCAYNKGTYFITPKGKPHIDELREELAGCSANIFVAVGGVALYALTGLSGIMKWRGSIVESNLLPGRKVIGILHPATVIPPKNVYLNKYLIIRDLQKARVESEDSKIHRLNRSIAIGPSFLDVKHWLAMIYDKGKKYGKIDWYDIELYNEELACISFGWNEFNCISIPFIGPNGDYFSIEQEAEIMAFLAKIMEDPSIEKGGQNIVFDSHFLLRRYGIKAKNLHDTMIAQRILFPEFPIGLDFIASIYTTIPYYKDEGKRWRKLSGDWNKLWTYNANDSLACAEAFPKQRYDLERQGNLETYERQRKLIEPLTYMMERGIRIDLDGMAKEKAKLEARVEANQERLNSIVGFELNPNSPAQVKNYFYNIKGHPPYKKWDATKRKHTITSDETAMKRLARKGFEEASLILDIRGDRKVIGTYVDADKFDKDGRLRCSFNPAGTKFSRLASSKSIFGTGMNMQNWPENIRRHLLADEGYVGYCVDLAQAENRIVAYVGPVSTMIDAFENGLDLHRISASVICGVPYMEVSSEKGSSPIGGGKHSQRDWGKRANHAFDYGYGYKNFALKFEIPETEAKIIYMGFHKAHPGVANNYWTMVQAMLRTNNRTITNLLGRKTILLDKWGEDLLHVAYSCIPQGSVGDVINERGLEEMYYDEKKVYAPAELLNQVHDDIWFQIPLSYGWDVHANIILHLKASLEETLKWRSREFVIPMDLTMGLSFMKEEGFELKSKDFPKTKEELAKKLEEGYRSLAKCA